MDPQKKQPQFKRAAEMLFTAQPARKCNSITTADLIKAMRAASVAPRPQQKQTDTKGQ